ncbi:MAG: prepilin-type N-terminal cleavage/methylation domain-containing protein [Gemmatimonadales bacterium]
MTRRRAFTLIELMIALVTLSIVLTGALRLFRSVNTAVAGTADRMDAMQQLRFGLSQIDLLLRNAGAGTVSSQPTLVYIDKTIVVFNADWISLYPGSPTAVNYNPDADPNSSNAVTVAQRFTIPTTAIQYPDSTYHTAGGISAAETIIYYFEPDTSTPRTDDYHLMRQVNNSPPQEVAKNILAYPGHDFFEWLRTDSAGNLQQVVATGSGIYPALPWRHSNPIHGSLTDTGAVAKIDSIRAVRLYAFATNGQTGTREIKRSLVTTVRIPNAGLAIARSCGMVPIFGQTPVATSTGGSPATPKVHITWTRAVDEGGGEKDVERYLIYRRLAAGTFDDALAEIPAGLASYTYDDATVLWDSTYYYGVTAIDCTPAESPRGVSNAILVFP